MLLTDVIAETAWLISQYENARTQCVKAGKFLNRTEFMEKPGYTIALTPMALLTIQRLQIPFASVVIHQAAPPQHQNRHWQPLNMRPAWIPGGTK